MSNTVRKNTKTKKLSPKQYAKQVRLGRLSYTNEVQIIRIND